MQPSDPVAALRQAFPKAVQDVIQFRGETTIIIDPPQIARVAAHLRDAEGLKYNFLVSIVGVDYLPESPRFAVDYHLHSLIFNQAVRLKVRLEEGQSVPSVTPLWSGANWQEREVYDMFGITFEGHPDLRRILMPEGWDGFPHRKDYPLGYEVVQFSFNFDEINRNKPYAKE